MTGSRAAASGRASARRAATSVVATARRTSGRGAAAAAPLLTIIALSPVGAGVAARAGRICLGQALGFVEHKVGQAPDGGLLGLLDL